MIDLRCLLAGLILVPNGEAIGYALGDEHPSNRTEVPSVLGPRSSTLEGSGSTGSHPWGVLFTVLGTVFLDFDADACQSPARAYLLDVTVPGQSYLNMPFLCANLIRAFARVSCYVYLFTFEFINEHLGQLNMLNGKSRTIWLKMRIYITTANL